MNPADYTIQKSVIAWVATLLVLVGGYIAYQGLGRYEDPEFVIRQRMWPKRPATRPKAPRSRGRI